MDFDFSFMSTGAGNPAMNPSLGGVRGNNALGPTGAAGQVNPYTAMAMIAQSIGGIIAACKSHGSVPPLHTNQVNWANVMGPNGR